MKNKPSKPNSDNDINPQNAQNAQNAQKLEELIKDKRELEKLNKLKLLNSRATLLKKSKFYRIKRPNGKLSELSELREHIGNYREYGIFLKQEEMLNIDDITVIKATSNEAKINPSIILIKDIKFLKAINGNIIRKIQPKTIHEIEKMSVLLASMEKIDKLKES